MSRAKPRLSSQAETSRGEGAVEPCIWRWESGSRAYVAEVTYDLFGELILRCTNAGTGKRHYQERTIACGSDAIRDALRQLSALRRSHGYTVIETRATDVRASATDMATTAAAEPPATPSPRGRARRSPQFFQRCHVLVTSPTCRQGVRSDVYLRHWLGV